MSYEVKRLCERIWAFEKNENAFAFKFRGVWVWQAFRMKYYYQIACAEGIFEEPHYVSTNESKVRKIKIAFSYLFYTFFKNAFVAAILNRSPVAILEHERQQLHDGVFQDIYSAELKDSLEREGTGYVSLRRRFLGEHKNSTRPGEKRIFLDALVLFGAMMRKMPLVGRMTKDDKKKLSDFVARLRLLSSDWSISEASIIAELIRQNALVKVYRTLFRILGTQKLYVVVAYAFPEIITAARSLNIEIIELQHGIVNRYHLGYSYPDECLSAPVSLSYFPDVIESWGKEWTLNCKLPISQDKIWQSFGWPLRHNLVATPDNIRKGTQITIISQGSIGDGICQFVAQILKVLPTEAVIKYKLHPSEFGRFQSYELASQVLADKRVELIERGSLIDLLKRSGTVFGVYSTGLIEAQILGCDVYIFPLAGSEYFEGIDWAKPVPDFKNLTDPAS